MKKLFLIFVASIAFSQQKVDSLLQVGNSFYKKKDFKTAAQIWEKASELAENKISKQEYYYYTSMAFAEAKDSTNSFRCIEKSIKL